MSEGERRRAPLDLVLVRHGATDWNEAGILLGRSDVPLNERGRAQARAAAGALAGFSVRAILASPQGRARETAALIAERTGCPVEIEAGLAEVWVASHLQGKPFSELRNEPDIVRSFRDPTYECESFEPIREVQERVVPVAERAARSHAQGAVVLVSHGDPLRALLSHVLRQPLGEFRRLAVSTGSISIVRFDVWRSQLVALNWRPGDLRLCLEG